MNYLALLIAKYGYFILFPLSIVEGPVVTIIAGFFVSLGILNFFWVYAIAVTGDAIGDSICYGFGRWGGEFFFKRIGSRIGVTRDKLEKVKNYFDLHGHKTITLSKLIHGIGFTGLIAAGSLKVPYRKYVATCFLITIIQSAAVLAIGVIFGHAYAQLIRYLDYFTTVTVIAGIFIVFFILIFKKFKINLKQ